MYAVAVGHRTGIFLRYEAACSAYKRYPGAKFKGLKDMSKAKQYLKDNEPPNAVNTKPKITRKKPKSYGWSQKGTKASRRAAKPFAASKNVIEAEVLQFKRSKSSHSDENMGIKRLARTGGIKDLSKPEVIDLCNGSRCRSTAEPQAPRGQLRPSRSASKEREPEASVYKDVTSPVKESLTHLKSKAVKSLVRVIGMKRTDGVGVRLTRSFAPGLTTTTVHRGRV